MINHKIVKWAREKEGLSIEKASQKSGFSEELLKDWESKYQIIAYQDLTILADIYKTATAVFFLPEIPTATENKIFTIDKQELAIYGNTKKPYMDELIILENDQELANIPLTSVEHIDKLIDGLELVKRKLESENAE